MAKKKNFLVLGLGLAITGSISLGGAALLGKNGLFGNLFHGASGDGLTYDLKINRTLSTPDLSSGATTFLTEYGNPITFKFDVTKVSTSSDGVFNLLNGGYLYNETAITGMYKISITASGGSATVSYGNVKENLTKGSQTINATSGEETFNINIDDASNYFRIHDVSGTMHIKNIKVSYMCYNDSEAASILKTAVFADVQLKNRDNNMGNTANCHIALENHLKLCKAQNVDALLMVGDIVNNAVSSYYDTLQEAFVNVYGTDKSKYPEIIATMGNHEWWDTNEKDTANSVQLFNSFADIDSPALVRKSTVPYYLDSSVTVPTYYKVVNGIPFLMVSGENSNGRIGTTMANEIKTWLQEISLLPSVVNGGPIYVGYHYPLSFTLTHGNGAFGSDGTMENLLKDYPQAVVFTGDTHYPGVNERAINQVDFTAINIGTSSYSRMEPQSATMTEDQGYYNLKLGGTKSSDITIGNSDFKHEYTPTIHLMDTNDNYSTVINRYFSTDNPDYPTHINKPWRLAPHLTKSTFTYTNERFANTASANSLYGADGLSWTDSAEVQYGVKDGTMTVKFPNVTDYHYCEHFQIKVTSNQNKSKTYDVVSNYYIYSLTPDNQYFTLDKLPKGDTFSVEVTAFDYFDNPSLNKLTSSNQDDTICIDAIDDTLADTYSDISSRVNVEDTAPDSPSSIEYYFRGTSEYKYGAILNRLYDVDPLSDSAAKKVSLGNASNATIVASCKVKNLSNQALKVGLTVRATYGQEWRTDFGAEKNNIKEIPANSGWIECDWDLTFMFGFKNASDIKQINMKATPKGGMDAKGILFMSFLIDDVDIKASAEPETLDDGWENMKRDDGQTRCSVSFDSQDTKGSSYSAKLTFKDAEPDKNNGYEIMFSPQHEGISNQVDFTKGSLEFDVKFSSDVTDTRMKLFVANKNWEDYRHSFTAGSPDSNGWRHVEISLGSIDGASKMSEVIRVGFLFLGINDDNKDTAIIHLDNINYLPNGNVPDAETLNDGLENLPYDTGWETSNHEMTYKYTCGSAYSVKISFDKILPDTHNGYAVVFSPESAGIANSLDMTSGTLEFDVAYSNDISNKDILLILITNIGDGWKAQRTTISVGSPDANGWSHVVVDLASLPIGEAPQTRVVRLGFGFKGINDSNKSTAVVYLDNIIFTPVA